MKKILSLGLIFFSVAQVQATEDINQYPRYYSPYAKAKMDNSKKQKQAADLVKNETSKVSEKIKQLAQEIVSLNAEEFAQLSLLVDEKIKLKQPENQNKTQKTEEAKKELSTSSGDEIADEETAAPRIVENDFIRFGNFFDKYKPEYKNKVNKENQEEPKPEIPADHSEAN